MVGCSEVIEVFFIFCAGRSRSRLIGFTSESRILSAESSRISQGPRKRRSGQLAPSNHDPHRSNDPVGRIVVNGAHNATIWRARSSILDPRSKSFCNENPGIEPIAIGQNWRAMASQSIRSDEQIGTNTTSLEPSSLLRRPRAQTDARWPAGPAG